MEIKINGVAVFTATPFLSCNLIYGFIFTYAKNIVCVKVEHRAELCESIQRRHFLSAYVARYLLMFYSDFVSDFRISFSALLYGFCKFCLYFA